MKSKRIAKILGVGLSVGMVVALLGAIFVAPVAADEMKWGIVNTPSWEDYEIFPNSDILDYAIDGDDGETVFAVIQPLVELFSSGNGSAAWSTSNEQTGSYSAMLTGGAQDGGANYAAVVIPVNGTLMLTNIATLAYTYVFENDGQPDGGPHMCFYTHDINDGETGEVTLYSGDAGPPPGQPATAGTHTTNVVPATDGFFWYGTENDSALAGGVLNTHTLAAFQADVAFQNHVIDRIQIEYGWWGAGSAAEPAYVDDVVINSDMCFPIEPSPMLLKSDDGGVTWTNITDNVQDASGLPEDFIALSYVDVAPDDKDWLAVVGTDDAGTPMVVASQDGGDNFSYAGDMVDTSAGTAMAYVYDLAVSIEVDDIHNIAVAGINDEATTTRGTVFRLKAGTWLTGAWEDTSYDLGWDNGTGTLDTDGVVACAFSPNFDLDDTLVFIGVADGVGTGIAYLQSGMWEGSSVAWNDEAGFPTAVEIESDGDTLLTGVYMRSCGLALPDDYDGTDPGQRSIFLYANAYETVTNLVGGYVFRVDNASISPVCSPPGDPLLASMDVHGDADTGKIMIGEYMRWDNDAGDPGDPLMFDCCAGVRVWHTEEIDFCCPQWDGACKDPSGPYMALVTYTPDGDKEYASTSGILDTEFPGIGFFGGLCDESAFSVSWDDAVSFNQLSIIDTDIDFLSDVAVCPDCSTVYLSTVNVAEDCEICDCDSVWRSYDDGATWERIFHGPWAATHSDVLMLRLPCDAIEDCCDQDAVAPSGTVYLGLQGNDEIYYSRDCGQCWNNPPATKELIQDFAVESENIVYVLGANGKVSKSTQYGRRWSTPVDTKVTTGGHSITSCCEEGFVVVGGTSGGKVAWSDDGGETWTRTDALPATAGGEVHVACDPVCENIIYAAVDGEGIYRCDITGGSWDDLEPLPYDYTGIVVAREGTLYASTNEISVETGIDSYIFTDCKGRKLSNDPGDTEYSGVARNLTPCDTACCGTEDWDYLMCGMNPQSSVGEQFENQPTALRICGCLSADTNSVLWAIDVQPYDVVDGKGDADTYGSLWSYEDCAAKAGPNLTAPADGAVLDCEACAGCGAAPFTLKWERMCLACSYDVQIMDEDGNLIVEWVDKTITGDPPKLYVDSSEMFMVEADGDITIYFPSDDGLLECGNTYTWKVREANTSCECVHSPWSETWSFTVAVGTADAIKLLAPVAGALGVPIANIGFSWTSVPDATTYSFVLSPNAALTGALASQDLSSTAFNFVGPLDYDKAYYWQIKAWKDSQLLTTSAIGVFNTGSEPVTPPPPVVVEPTPAPILEIPPAQQITPTWIYAIIGIGAALAVVVIVLIVRTRRP